LDGYDGICNDDFVTLKVRLLANWSLVLNYTYASAKKTHYSLDAIRLSYRLDPELFPEATYVNEIKSVESSGLYLFPASKDDSYKCWSLTSIRVKNVNVNFLDYQGQPFMDQKSKGFDTGILNFQKNPSQFKY
jgi:hypothetical protein